MASRDRAEEDSMDVEAFTRGLGGLSERDVTGIAAAIGDRASSAAGEVAWWHATLEIERRLRAGRLCREANMAGYRAARAVQEAAVLAGMSMSDSRVVVVARAAADVARGVVAGSDVAVSELLLDWRGLVAI